MTVANILAISGRKQAGKSTAAAFLRRNAYELMRRKFVSREELVNVYAFATPLKQLCVDVLGLSHDQVYGTNEQKAQPTHLLWENFPNAFVRLGKSGPMTAREVLQYAGTEIFRHWDGEVWTRATVRRIAADAPALAVIDDLRFPNEAAAVKAAGGKVVRLGRAPAGPDEHPSETAMDGYPDFDLVIDNSDMTADDTHRALVFTLREWGWVK